MPHIQNGVIIVPIWQLLSCGCPIVLSSTKSMLNMQKSLFRELFTVSLLANDKTYGDICRHSFKHKESSCIIRWLHLTDALARIEGFNLSKDSLRMTRSGPTKARGCGWGTWNKPITPSPAHHTKFPTKQAYEAEQTTKSPVEQACEAERVTMSLAEQVCKMGRATKSRAEQVYEAGWTTKSSVEQACEAERATKSPTEQVREVRRTTKFPAEKV